MCLETERWMRMSGRSTTQPSVPSSAFTCRKVFAPTFCVLVTCSCWPHESRVTREALRSGALCSWTGTVAITHTDPAVDAGVAFGELVRAEVAVLLGEDCPKPQAVPADSPSRQVTTGAKRIIRLTS